VLGLFGPATYGSRAYREQAEELITKSANLNDRQKMIAEYFADGPHSELPPGHWDLFAQFVSTRDHHGLDEEFKLFFALTNAIFDAGIVAWDAKRAFDSVRPATAVPHLFQGQQIQAWGGPGKGTVTMDGRFWIPYQLSTFPTPPFPEFISGHSTFSAAGAAVLRLFTGSDAFGDSVTLPAGSSKIEPGLRHRTPSLCDGKLSPRRRIRWAFPDATAEFISKLAISLAGRWDKLSVTKPISEQNVSGADLSEKGSDRDR
jgi:hypothetical protein